MIAVFILKGNEYVQIGNAHPDTPAMRNQMKREAEFFIREMGVADARVFKKI